MSIQNQIIEDGKPYELISGPWEDSEVFLMKRHIGDMERGSIRCIEKIINGKTWVYRDACGYLNARDFKGTLKQPSSRFCKKWVRPKESEYRKLLKELQSDRLQTA